MYESQSVIHPVDNEKCICKICDSGKRLRERKNKREREGERKSKRSKRRLVDFSFFSFFF